MPWTRRRMTWQGSRSAMLELMRRFMTFSVGRAGIEQMVGHICCMCMGPIPIIQLFRAFCLHQISMGKLKSAHRYWDY
jgi:hypothetical protein